MIQREALDGVLVLRLAHGKVNALDLELLEAIASTFEALATTSSEPIVFTASGPAFSAGVDLKRILDGGASYAERFLPALDRAFESVLSFPRPVVAAINGHAIAGGCIFACACDRRVLARGNARIGAPELKVGVAWPALALELLRHVVSAAHFRELVFDGITCTPDDALRRGLVDEIVEPSELVPRASQIARELASLPATAFRLAKEQVAAPIRAACVLARDREKLVRADWASAETRARLSKYLERLAARK